jgi:hypothetical protein
LDEWLFRLFGGFGLFLELFLAINKIAAGFTAFFVALYHVEGDVMVDLSLIFTSLLDLPILANQN